MAIAPSLQAMSYRRRRMTDLSTALRSGFRGLQAIQRSGALVRSTGEACWRRLRAVRLWTCLSRGTPGSPAGAQPPMVRTFRAEPRTIGLMKSTDAHKANGPYDRPFTRGFVMGACRG